MRHSITFAAFFTLVSIGCATTPTAAPEAARPVVSSQTECAELASLTPAARAQVMTIAGVLEENPRWAIDFSRVGLNVLALGYQTMITFASDPATTREDVILFIPAKKLIRSGLDPSKFDPVPPRGEMESGKWYYSSGETPESRFNDNEIGTPVLMMAVDTEAE